MLRSAQPDHRASALRPSANAAPAAAAASNHGSMATPAAAGVALTELVVTTVGACTVALTGP
jgi:hypothetical protein